MLRILVLVSAGLIAAPLAAEAACGKLSVGGTKCLKVAPTRAPYAEGDALPEGAELVMNPRYYGLPPVDGPWRYYLVGREVYRVDSATLTVIERVHGANRGLF